MFLATRELFHAKLRYVLIGLIIILVASLIFIISGLAKGLSANNAASLEDMNANYLVMEKDVDHDLGKSQIKQDQLDNVKDIEGVKDVAPLSIMMTDAKINDAEKGIDMAFFMTSENSMLIPDAVEGKNMKSKTDIVVDEGLKDEGVKLGDVVNAGDVKLTITGFAKNERYSHTPVAYVADSAFGDVSDQKINAMALQTNDVKQEDLSNTLNDFDVVNKKEALNGVPSYSEEQASLNMMIVFLLVIAAFVLAVFFYVMTLQKRDQFGVLKALGAKTSYLIKNLMSQVAILTVVCIGLGVALTYGVAMVLPDDMPFVIDGMEMLQSSFLVLVVSILGALTSLFQVVKVDPIEAIEGGTK